MERMTLEDLRGPGATLGAGVSAGFLAGVLIGGVGGRLAMLSLRLTSDPSLHGVSTDDGFTIGRVSAETLFLLGVTAGLGIAGGLFYLVVRRWIPAPWRIPVMTLFFALVGGAGVIGPSDVDFTQLSPLSLAVAFFVVIPAAYGAMMPWIAERLLREDSILRRGRWAWIVGLVPLVFANIVGALILLVALGMWALGRSAPGLVEAWRSQVTTWLGRAALVAMAVASGAGLLRDGIDILG
ncbi:MAG: hypothetical protein M3P43_08605 [Actinomycetota bacterium]|nr:hypothetical protein [Actinomycetota bacterium]